MPGTVAYEVKAWGEPEEEIVWVAGATESIFGITHQEWTQRGAFDFVMDESGRARAQDSAALITDGKSPPMLELASVHTSGHPVFVRLDKVSRHLPNGNLLIVNHDITAEVQLRNMTERHVIQMAITNRFKAATAYLSHEIRNQLFPQSMILEAIKEEFPDCETDVELILSANTTVTSILNHVLELAKWESGELPIDTALFPIIRLVKAAASYAAAKGATIRGIESINDTWYIKADEHILKQAYTNLISNGDKFRDNTDLTVTFSFEKLSKHNGTLVVVVEDAGRGMTTQQLETVLIPFGQIRTADEQHGGTGLGLPLTKAMIEIGHNGKLTLESAGLGRGTRATAQVPVEWLEQRQPQEEPTTSMSWVTVDPDAGIDVLIVDDAVLNRKVTARMCKKLGLTYDEAENGLQAVEMMAVKNYSLVTMDQEMPVMIGSDAVETARKAGYDGPIVLVSGNTFEPRNQADLIELGVTAFLTKMAVPGVRDALQKLSLEKNTIPQT
jgi:signal transduction histidine kinase/ActR/RegA family two-component response regulator